jgi:hypothetical protein
MSNPVFGRKHQGEVLGTVHVPGHQVEQDGLLRARRIALRPQLRPQLRRQRGSLGHKARRSPQFHALARPIVHDKQHGPRVLAQITGRDVLAVAGIIGKTERVGSEHAQEPLGPSAVLDIGLPAGARAGEIKRARAGREFRQLGR